MAAPMWRMNGLWRRMAGLLLLCALLLSYEVMCQEDQTAATNTHAADPAAGASAATDAPGSPADSDGTAAPSGDSAHTIVVKPDSNPSAAPSDPTISVTAVIGLDSQVTDAPAAPAAPAVVHEVAPPSVILENPVVSDRVPHVECVKQEDIQEGSAVIAEVETDNCEQTKRIIEENPAKWGCHTDECNLEIFQDGNTMLVATKNAKLRNVADVLMSEPLKERVGVKKAETPSSSSGSSVFVGILVTGLLAALAITIGYFKCQRRTDGKGVRLAEEAYPVDQENQGNTLVSVAPLNPPPETPEKPSVNGESPEAAKTQPPPPTNGHSTAKTADTEL